MTYFAIFSLALAMSMDAFAVSIAKGACFKHPSLKLALRTALIFGLVEGITPIIGWLFGAFSSQYVAPWAHWIAFILLVILGGKMIVDSFSDEEDEEICTKTKQRFFTVILAALATSIDAMAVGVSLAFISVNIIGIAMAIGFTTFCMVTIGIMIGRFIGPMFGRYAERAGGALLLIIALSILT